MVLKTSSSSTLSLTNVSAWAWCSVGASAGYMVYDACLFLFRKFVLWLYKGFTKRPTGRDGGGEALTFEYAGEGLRDAGEIGKVDVAATSIGGGGQSNFRSKEIDRKDN